MGKLLKVIDNIVPAYIQSNIESYAIASNINWAYYSNVTDESDNFNPGFNHTLLEYNADSKYEPRLCNPDIWMYLQSLYITASILKLNIQTLFTARLFLQTPSLKREIILPHTDLDHSHLVFLYYINDSDGDTIFLKNNKVFKKVSPKKGRVVIFDGSIEHSGGVPIKSSRFVLNVDFLGEFQ